MKLTRKQAKAAGIVPKKDKAARERLTQANARAKQNRQVLLASLAQHHGLPAPHFEVTWHPTRDFRFDLVFQTSALDIAVEQIGGVWCRGHHSRGRDQIEDMFRRNEAQRLGWVVLEFPPEQLNSGAAFAYVQQFIQEHEG